MLYVFLPKYIDIDRDRTISRTIIEAQIFFKVEVNFGYTKIERDYSY